MPSGKAFQDSSDFIEATHVNMARGDENEISVISSSALRLKDELLRSNEFKVTRSNNDVNS